MNKISAQELFEVCRGLKSIPEKGIHCLVFKDKQLPRWRNYGNGFVIVEIECGNDQVLCIRYCLNKEYVQVSEKGFATSILGGTGLLTIINRNTLKPFLVENNDFRNNLIVVKNCERLDVTAQEFLDVFNKLWNY